MSESPNVSNSPAQQTGQAAKQETRATADRAKEAAGTVAGSAKEQARTVTSEARRQAMDMADHLKERAAKEADTQTKKTADAIRQWADDLSGMAESTRSDSPVRNLVAQAADGGRRAADTLESRGAGGLLEGVETFARRRPGAFLFGAALAGFAVARMAKAGAKAEHQGPDGAGGEYYAPSSMVPVAAGGGEARPGPGPVPTYAEEPSYGETDVTRRPEVG
ncbi:hypothetical protein [Streptomyces macrosporus]|uniref:Late embryogenesis abundant protein n=1 Tax=Streptomyces macrosporus TaxID=44032 RepID=A0ABN3JNX2_9ACTN